MSEVLRTKEEEWLLSEKYGGTESQLFHTDCERLQKGEPLAYVIGFSMFLGAHIDLSLHPLIPRSETEYWTERAISDIRAQYGNEKKLRCLDLFSGSGCIGIAVLKHMPNATMSFVDIEPTFLEQIQINLDLNHIDPSRYSLILSDVFENVPSAEKYDILFANPPYIAETGKDSFVEDAVRNYEPHGALFAPSAGMALISRTLVQARDFLAPEGKLYLEHSDEQVVAITALLNTNNISGYTFNKDQFGLQRYLELS